MSKHVWILVYLIVLGFTCWIETFTIMSILHPSPVFSCASHNGVRKIDGPVKEVENGQNFYYVTECNDGAVNWQ